MPEAWSPETQRDPLGQSFRGARALSRDLEFTRKFLIDYQDRMLFGRDQFDNGLCDILLSLNLPADVLAKILSGNALRLVPV